MYKGFTYSDGTGKTAVVEDHANITADRVKLFDAVVDADAYNKTQTKTATASKAWRQYYYAFPASYNWVMKNAKDGVITFDYYGDNDKIYGCIAHDSFSLEELGLKDGDKVKLIIIKEEEQ